MEQKNDRAIKQAIHKLAKNADHELLAIWAAECAERVLPIFNENYKEDSRPSDAIRANRNWIKGKCTVSEAREAAFAAHAAARDAVEDNCCYAARSAGHAAATVHVATHAVYASDYAAKVNPTERIWDYHRLVELLQEGTV